jgi:hypothetical protein
LEIEFKDEALKIKFTYLLITNNANVSVNENKYRKHEQTTSLPISKRQIKTSITYHNTPNRRTKIKTVTTPNAGEEVET